MSASPARRILSAAPRARAGIVFDGRQPAAGFPQAEADPDGAVAVGRADLERPLRAARDDHDAKKATVFLGDRELILVGGFDLLQDGHDVWRHALNGVPAVD